jgi:prepilin-type N-terminal cleavage/methylation domain-containing protein
MPNRNSGFFQLHRGFSVLELIIVMAIGLVIASSATVGVRLLLASNRLDVSYRATMLQARRARQLAIDGRRVHVVTFTAPRTIRIQRVKPDTTLELVEDVNLQNDIEFRAETGIPTASADTPDRFGTGSTAIDFNGSNKIYFQPDGSALDASGAINNGVIYLARPGQLDTARAMTLYGSTGRIKGWNLKQVGGSWKWQ